MNKRLFIMGQCTMHWGRMEFGNIGNYYIVKPMFQNLRRVFPDFEIVTSMQFSKEFCEQYNIEMIPMECFYDFNSEGNLKAAQKEYDTLLGGGNPQTQYIDEVQKADLVIDFSGDIWGKNADFLGKDRFATGVYKDLSAQLLKPTVMVAGSPGPFYHDDFLMTVKQAYKGFSWVTNREPVSKQLLITDGFDVTNSANYACPSFLFEAASDSEVFEYIDRKSFHTGKLNIGFMLCGWNFKRGPFDVWPRDNSEYDGFIELAENLIQQHGAQLFLISHSNGFDIPPAPFLLKHGRDYPIMQQFKKILDDRGYGSNVHLFDGVYSPEVTKGIISHFDILVSGRMHGAVAGLSQYIPTLILDYGHEPKAHKLRGFAEMCNIQDYIVDPNNAIGMIEKAHKCIENKEKISEILISSIPIVKRSGIKQFEKLAEYCK